jgi:DNA polymerase III delta subunit
VSRSKFVAVNVFYGGEDYLLDRAKERALSWPDREVTLLDGQETSEDELISAMDQMVLGSDGVSVVLENAQKLKLSQDFIGYLAARPEGDTSSVLTALVRSDKLPKTWTDVVARGRVFHHARCKPWDERGIRTKIQAEAKLLGLTLEDGALSALHKVYAENIGSAVNELRKLRFIVPKGGTVTKAQVLSVCSRQLPVMPWDVAEAACQKSKRKALGLAGLLFKYEGEGAAIPILASLLKNVERLVLARSLVDRGLPGSDVASALGLNPFVYEKNYASVVQRHTAEDLLTQMKKLCELETRVKGPAPSKRTLVELALLQLAE